MRIVSILMLAASLLMVSCEGKKPLTPKGKNIQPADTTNGQTAGNEHGSEPGDG